MGDSMNLGTGLAIAVLAGAINGLFAVPMKLNRRWAWENNWLAFSLLSLVIFPWLIAFLSVPNLPLTFSRVVPEHLILAGLWGIAIYSGSLMFGISLAYIGMALSFALLVGSMSVVGVFLPILLYSPQTLTTSGGKFIIAGVITLLATLVLSLWAGRLKEQAQAGMNTTGIGDQVKKSALVGMVLAIAGGVLSGFLSLGMNMDWAGSIRHAAVQFGNASPSAASNAVLALILLGGSIPNVAYCLYLLKKNGTMERFRHPSSTHYALMILVVGVMYSGSVALWGVAISESMLGKLGPSVGWALFIGSMVISSNLGGFATGEWKNAGKTSVLIMISSLVLMIIAMVLIGYGNFLVASS
jgi:L-rhamnose-H+ transport protein